MRYWPALLQIDARQRDWSGPAVIRNSPRLGRGRFRAHRIRPMRAPRNNSIRATAIALHVKKFRDVAGNVLCLPPIQRQEFCHHGAKSVIATQVGFHLVNLAELVILNS